MLLPLIPFALTVACCAFIPMIRKAMAKRPVFTARQKQEAAKRREANDSAMARQKMIDSVRSMEWNQWAYINGVFQ